MAAVASAFERATWLHQEGRLAEAGELYRAVLEQEPEHLGALLSWALLHAARQQTGEATELLDQALRQRPQSPAAQVCLADVFNALGRYEEAIQCYERVLAEGEQYAQFKEPLAAAHNNLGNRFLARHQLEEALDHYRQALIFQPESPEAHNNAGIVLAALNCMDEAVAHYRGAIDLRPAYPEAHNNLGNALLALHRYEEARTAYDSALDAKPDYSVAINNIGISLAERGRFDEALPYHVEALRLDPANRYAHQGLALAYFKKGDLTASSHHAAIGFEQRCESFPYYGQAAPICVLVLVSAYGGSVNTSQWFDNRVFARTTMAVDFCQADLKLPPHDLLVNAIGEADRAEAALLSAQALVASSGAAIVNRPSAVLATGRVRNAERLAKIRGVRAARTELWPRESITADALARSGFDWPLLLRTPGFHTGEQFVRVDAPGDVAAAIDALPGLELLVIEYVDTSRDGKFRKYRVMSIGGQLHPLHAAVSERWMVHFMTADMAEHPEHRAEDARFLEDMPGVLGPKAMRALHAVARTIDLDYGGIDFGFDAAGKLLVFEANATMVVPPPPSDERWDYRRPAVAAIHAAVRGMLLSRGDSSSRKVQAA